MRVTVLVSGGGANLQALLDLLYFDELPEMELVGVVSSAAGVYALERAANAGVPTYLVERELFPNDDSFSTALLHKLRDLDTELVVCAGFTQRVSNAILRYYRSRVINVQPVLFPAFCAGTLDPVQAVRSTLRLGLRVSGATAYLMGREDNGYGPVIAQRTTEVLPGDTPASLSERILRECEQPALVEAVRLFCRGCLRPEDGRVRIIAAPEQQQENKKMR